MKTIKKTTLRLAAAITVVIVAVICFIFSSGSTSVAHASDYRYEFESYSVTYDIRGDRTMDVRLDVTVKLLGWDSTGIIYDIPVNAGDRVRNLKAYSLVNGKTADLEYSIENDDGDFVSVYLDDYTKKHGQTKSYRVEYEYAITQPKSKNEIYLNAIGFGSDAVINDAQVVINLPEGFQSAKCFVGRAGVTDEYNGYEIGGDKITLSVDRLDTHNGVTFSLAFADGALSTKTDMTPYWIIIAACAVFAVIFALKFLVFNKNDLTPVPCFSVPVNPPEMVGGEKSAVYDDPTREMDPLIMGKLIDNKVDSSDVTSLLYYWANKGYIKINMENQKDIVLIRIYNTLPEGTPNYQKTMYYSLFDKSEIVHVNSLTNKFYTTVEKVTKEVNTENGKLYDGKSMAVAIAFALFGALALCLTPIFTAIFSINRHLLLIAPLFMVIPAFAVFALTQTIKYKTLKFKKSKLIGFYCLVGLLALLFSALYIILVPSYVMEALPKFLLAAISFAIVMLSVSLINRTEEYGARLNRIVGFKEFIETAEKDKLETMLESNPEFYYNILPYAIVLGVSDVWADKFKGLTMEPPQWATGDFTDTVFSVMLFNSLMRNVNANMVTTFLSRPSSGGSSGFHGSFGGFGGGGHGGGGFRGK